MNVTLAQSLMDEFADATGVTGRAIPRRYLWTDAYAVCNFVGLRKVTGDLRYLKLARVLVDQVHHILGRHRDDDPRSGWISGLAEKEGELHPTCGGLRIGKPLNERAITEPFDERLEWERDGQYFHYLTKWMHALDCMTQATGESSYRKWAIDLAAASYRAFFYATSAGVGKRIAWKMSIDLSRPLISLEGQHDPIEGLINFLQLTADRDCDALDVADLSDAVAEMTRMCTQGRWATEDLLGIGSLLDCAMRLARLVAEQGEQRRELLEDLLTDAEWSLRHLSGSSHLSLSAANRLAFRELGLSIGLQCVAQTKLLLRNDPKLSAICMRLLAYQYIGEQIEGFWSSPSSRCSDAWSNHCDINTVMLATSLASEGYQLATKVGQ
jgi:hypothetical protein